MPRGENLIGKVFTWLTVIDGPIKKDDKKIYWLCQCKCGKQKLVRADGLRAGTTKSCGCYKNSILAENNKKKQLDLKGLRFGKLIAVEKTEKRTKDGRVIWICKCDCGNFCEVGTHDLQTNKVNSCGCLKSKGELLIASLLIESGIPFETQKSFPSCKFPDTNYLAKFDFYVDGKYIIEYDGEQHFYYKNSDHTWNNKENYEKVIEHDNYKNQWCLKNNIPIIRIPYTKLSNLQLKDLLLETSENRIIPR